jgi:hypothetical protein
MPNSNLIVIISGNVRVGSERIDVVRSLQSIFKLSDAKAQMLLNGVQSTIKRCKTEQDAARYRAELERIGVEVVKPNDIQNKSVSADMPTMAKRRKAIQQTSPVSLQHHDATLAKTLAPKKVEPGNIEFRKIESRKIEPREVMPKKEGFKEGEFEELRRKFDFETGRKRLVSFKQVVVSFLLVCAGLYWVYVFIIKDSVRAPAVSKSTVNENGQVISKTTLTPADLEIEKQVAAPVTNIVREAPARKEQLSAASNCMALKQVESRFASGAVEFRSGTVTNISKRDIGNYRGTLQADGMPFSFLVSAKNLRSLPASKVAGEQVCMLTQRSGDGGMVVKWALVDD